MNDQALCRHLTSADVHTFFLIDRSSSMGSTYCTPDNERGIRELDGFNEDLENVLGVVYEATYKYMWARAQNAPHDLVAFLPFNDSAQAVFTAEPISNSTSLMQRMLQVDPHKGTKFGVGIKQLATLQEVRRLPSMSRAIALSRGCAASHLTRLAWPGSF